MLKIVIGIVILLTDLTDAIGKAVFFFFFFFFFVCVFCHFFLKTDASILANWISTLAI